MLAALNGGPGGALQVLSEGQKAEIARVNGLQVRTNASDQATKLLAGKAPNMTEWVAVAQVIEHYIWEGADIDLTKPLKSVE
jgi:hypothetical protein